MKLKLYLLAFVLALNANVCHAQKKAAFTYPDDIADSAKKSFVKQFNQGMILYKISCNRCHIKIVGGKEVIPDFSLPQLMDYEIRIFPEHNEKLTDNKVSDEELAKIVLFLRYKEKSVK